MDADRRSLLVDSLMAAKGYDRSYAVMLVDEYRDSIARQARKDSDHSAYRELADVLNEVIHAESDPDDWDGDDSELELLCKFSAWLPDMVRHGEAEKLRARSPEEKAYLWIAETMDPFEKNEAGQWIRKSDGAPVPWPVVKE